MTLAGAAGATDAEEAAAAASVAGEGARLARVSGVGLVMAIQPSGSWLAVSGGLDMKKARVRTHEGQRTLQWESALR
ncbi:hypothetical protein Prum_028080 [Phytohabitans rumicis]|uniref:Uncharacterized protein n=1 Tax=Phytohabitans rumicis TaxID=1076125 RepID=A0A6V8L4W6_9ACTN|nr:hypothetical protein Prum_028080 [Phytohabitans rumicis]